MQQNAYDTVDEATAKERQIYIFDFIHDILIAQLKLEDKDKALHFFQKLRQLFCTWNSCHFKNAEFNKLEEEISILLEEKRILAEA